MVASTDQDQGLHSSLLLVVEEPLLDGSAFKRLLTILFSFLRLHELGRCRCAPCFLLFDGLLNGFVPRLLLRLFLLRLRLRRRLGLGLLLLLLDHIMILHGLPPHGLAPSRFDLIGLGPDLLNLCANHCLCGLIALPLLDAAHTLGVELVHSLAFLLYVCHDGNVGNAPLHQRLRQKTMMICGLTVRHGLPRLPAVRFALGLDFVILVHS
mmetsp:Transcript_461/g.1030  ORF Transcript_461/g.1030 Transcript_461/m.1030 type:complete len:210 (-) Transcript_461:421-1050(-)